MLLRARGAVVLAVLLAALTAAAPAHAAITGEPTQVGSSFAAPWNVAALGDGSVYVTDRDRSAVEHVTASGARTTVFSGNGAPTGTTIRVLGMALHPNFASNGFAYLFQRYNGGDAERSRVLRLTRVGSGPQFSSAAKVVFDGIPAGDPVNHDGGRIAFGPDGKLYVTTGDQHQPSRPQDLESLNGKILRLNAPGDDTDGTAPADNPFSGANAKFVWSYGHRHPQGLAWDATGRMWETEHGPSGEGHAPAGANRARDELNLIVKGGNYGWPLVAGEQTRACTIPPAVHSGTETWAPGGLAFAPQDGLLYAPALAGQHLHVFELDGDRVTRHGKLLTGAPADRMRAATVDGDRLWLTTDTAPRNLLRTGLVAGMGTWDQTQAAPAPPTPPECPKPPATQPQTPADGTSSTTNETTTSTDTTPIVPLTIFEPTAAPIDVPAALDRLAGRMRGALGLLGRRGLLRRGSAGVRVGGLPLGRIVLQVRMRRGGRTITVASATVLPPSRAQVTVKARLTRRGRTALRRTARPRLTVRVTYRESTGRSTTRTARPLVLRR